VIVFLNGGAGIISNITDLDEGGGAGSIANTNPICNPGLGIDGGGTGGYVNFPGPVTGTDGTGGGGGGGGSASNNGGAGARGGNGVVIIRYK